MNKILPHEAKVIAALEAEGKTIIAHLPYNQLTEKVQIMIAEKMKKTIEHEYGVVSLIPQLRELFRAHNPAVTFYQQEVFNITTEKNQLEKDCRLHDTEDHAIATALGVSLGEFYSKLQTIKE